jgi:hypothetical protein
MVDLGLKPPPKMGPHEFVPSSQPVPIGHSFEFGGATWRVTWCQRARVGWLLMIVPMPVGSEDWYATPAGRKQGEKEFRRALKDGTLQVNPDGLDVKQPDPKLLAELTDRAKQ